MAKDVTSKQQIEALASNLASVAGNARSVDLLILGAGRGGSALLQLLEEYEWVNISSIVDIDQNAVAFTIARHAAIQTSTNPEKVLSEFHGDIVIDVTGDPHMTRSLAPALQLRQIELISGKSAKLLFDLVNHQLKSKKTIRSQNIRLDLLDHMLEITMQLEDCPPTAEILTLSLGKLHDQMQARRGMIVTFTDGQADEILHKIGANKPLCSKSACAVIQQTCQSLKRHERFKILSSPVMLPGSASGSQYNLVIPVWLHNQLEAALFLELERSLNQEQQRVLMMTSVHLNMAVKTLVQYRHLHSMASHDGLTEVFNRHYFEQHLRGEVNRIRRTEHGSLTCIFIDVDNFKHINDKFGHPVGDRALVEVANSIKSVIRTYDICARYGGDEFVVLMPSDTLQHPGLEKAGKRMLQRINEIQIPDAPGLTIGASIGIATLSSEILDKRKLLDLADQAVYQAKEAGKNCLRIHSDEQYQFKRSAR